MFAKKIIISILLVISSINTCLATNGRFGLGISNQPETNIENISFKIHTSQRSAYGGVLGVSNAETGGYVVGLKLYRKLIQEENLNFFGAIFGAYVSEDAEPNEISGLQGDLTIGVEYFFQGLEHLGFSFETGLSINTFNDFEFKTRALNTIQGAIHFYL